MSAGEVIPVEQIQRAIYEVRGLRVMLVVRRGEAKLGPQRQAEP